ncbi:MAG: hypothetical protein M3410_18740 [Acidobacteriota bacterium]|nr:hypothetical protein [Acidobacteriota bacterium]
MEQDAQTDVLYDFLYRDSSRITSYYAQIFGGHLTTVQDTDSESDTKVKGGKLSLQVASGDIKSSQENLRSQTRVLNPHDLIATDVLSQLRSDNRFNTDIEDAPNGSLVIADGTLLLIDRSMMGLAVIVLKMQVEEASRTARSAAEKAAVRTQKQVIPFLEGIDLPSGFLLSIADGVNIVGTLKDAGMEEPISTYYFRHGTAGLAGVYVIGIKEEPSHSVMLPTEQMIGAGQAAAAALKEMMFPPGSITVTPIALFREI